MDSQHLNVLKRLDSIIDTAIDSIITIDRHGIIDTFNKSSRDLFGYEAHEVIGKNVKMLMPEPYHSEHDHYMSRYHTTQEPRIIGIGREVKAKKKDGTIFPIRLAVSEVVLHDRVIYTGIIHDLTEVKQAQAATIALNKELEMKVKERTHELEVTINTLLSTNQQLEVEISEHKKTEQKLNESQAELQEALNKEKELSELKSRFVSMASHEFRTPLTSILSSASLISRYADNSQQDKREKHIDRIKSSVAHLTGILNDFLSLSKLEEGVINVNNQEVSLHSLLQNVVAECTSLCKSDQNIRLSLDVRDDLLVTDPQILKNILFNLISNALKYSDSDVHCHFTKAENQSLNFTISDKGIGIPQEDQKYLFTRFFRAGNVINLQGTGLGLNIVHRYITMLNGSIDFESQLGEGTVFKVTLPDIFKN